MLPAVRVFITLFIPVTLLFTAATHLIVPIADRIDAPPRAGVPGAIDINRPRVPEQCDLPIGIDWFGTRERCLAELCGGQNVYNEYFFDVNGRRRKNPCYGQSPTEFEGR